jgi:Domain of unknown function (DUF4136)
MKLLGCAIAVLLSLGQLPPKEGKIESITDQKANFAAFTTYKWEVGHQAYDPSIHKTIVDAVDAELTARGLRKLETGTPSVTVRYHTVVRTDVLLDKLDEFEREGKVAPTKTLGRLVIVMRDANKRQVWAADTVQAVNADPATRNRDIAQVVGRMFQSYPSPRK